MCIYILCEHHEDDTVISSESLPPKFGRNGHKNVELSRGDFYFYFFKVPPPTFELTPGGSFFENKNARLRGGHRKIGCIPSGNYKLFAVTIMLVVILGVVAHKLNKYRKSPSVCGWRRG